MKVMIWNVNGLRACLDKGFADWFTRTKPAVLGVQETRVREEQLAEGVTDFRGWQFHLTPAERPGYSGVGLWTRKAPASLVSGVGDEEFDREGRLQVVEYDRWVLLNGYFPNGKGKERDNSRVPYKLAFYERVLEVARAWRKAGKAVVIGGDFNTAHTELDIENWKSNQKTSGFLPEEREMVDRYLADGFHDVFRERNPDRNGLYTWWSQRGGARGRNVGWRIDYLLVSAEARDWVRKAWIEPEVMGSDHCPVGIDLVVPR